MSPAKWPSPCVLDDLAKTAYMVRGGSSEEILGEGYLGDLISLVVSSGRPDAIDTVAFVGRDGAQMFSDLDTVCTESRRLGHIEDRATSGRTRVSTEYCSIANGTWPHAPNRALGR